jgi:hypothetical protein
MVIQLTKNTIMVHYFKNSDRQLSANSGRSDPTVEAMGLAQQLNLQNSGLGIWPFL